MKRLRSMTEAELEAECDRRAAGIINAHAQVRFWKKMLTRAQNEQLRRRKAKRS